MTLFCIMTDFPITGLRNIGNICFINTMFQCFSSLKSIDEFLQIQVNGSTLQHRFLKMVQEDLRYMKDAEGCTIQLNHELLQHIYSAYYGRKFNSQQDISELLMKFFEALQNVAPQVYLNFGVSATNICAPNFDGVSYTLQLFVQEQDYSIDIGDKLFNAMFLQPDQVCSCGQDRVHFYGEVPKCLIITVHKLGEYDRANRCQNIRRDVQIKCQPNLLINGHEYEMKSAAKYVGGDGKGGGIGKHLRKLLCIPKKSYKKLEADKIFRDWEYRRADVEEARHSNPPKFEHIFEAECSSALYSSPPKTEPFSKAECSLISVSSPILRQQVQFSSSPRNLPYMNNLSGHYTSYVKRGDNFFYISDADVQQTSVVQTDDLSVLFYERK